MAKKISEEKRNEIIELSNAGFTNVEISKELGVSHYTIHRIVGYKDTSSSKKGHRLTNEGIEKMLQLKAKGLSNSKIAIELGIAKTTVNRYMGKQPTMNRAEYGSIIAHTTGESFVKEEPKVAVKKLKTVKTEVSFKGDIANYKASSEGQVRITFSTGVPVDLEKSDFFKLLTELCEIGNWLTENATNTKHFEQRLDGTYISQ